MTILELILNTIASLVSSLAWPVTLIIVVLIIKKPFFDILKSLKTFSAKGISLEFKDVLRDSSEKISSMNLQKGSMNLQKFGEDSKVENINNSNKLAIQAPHLAIIDAWQHFIFETKNVLQKKTHTELKNTNDATILNMLVSELPIEPEAIDIINDLRILRNKAAISEKSDISYSDALEYIDNAKIMSEYVELISQD